MLTDYTYIYKRTIINIPTNAATLLKGADKTNGGAFIADYGNKWQFNFGQYNIIQGIADGINWQTVNCSMLLKKLVQRILLLLMKNLLKL